MALPGRAFFETDFGRAYHALFDFLLSSDHSSRALQDYFESPLSGVERTEAHRIDAMVRGNRALDFDELHALACLSSPHFDRFEELLGSTQASIAFEYFEDVVMDIPGVDEAYKAEQLAAIKALHSLYEQAHVFTDEPADFIALLERISVHVARVVGQGPSSISIVDEGDSLRLDTHPYDAVYFCDLDSTFYPASTSHSAVNTLKSKINLPVVDHSIALRRRLFEENKARASKLFVCERVLTSGESDAVYPSFLLDEFIHICSQEGEEFDSFGLPKSLQRYLKTRNEDEFTANISLFTSSLKDFEPQPAAVLYRLTGKEQENLFPDYMVASDGTLILSPSAIETYINCPYSWFVSQRLRLDDLDEGVGPLERGTFAHAVLERFYTRFSDQTGAKRITSNNLGIAQRIFEQVFNDSLAAQFQEQGTRYLPQTPSEKAAAQHLKKTMMDTLSYQAEFLPEFEPAFSELSIKPEDQVMYAGVYLRGRVDRVDVDNDLKQYVVVDYKGSTFGHSAGFSDEQLAGLEEGQPLELPRKIQALIYAKALTARMNDYRPQGALYMSYSAKKEANFVSGSVSQLLFDDCQASKQSLVECNFDFYLTLIEEAVALRLEDLKKGNIAPEPRSADACRYCEVLDCPRRLL